MCEAGRDLDGFIDFLDGFGLPPFESDGEHQKYLAVDWIKPEDLEKNASLLALHPRVRNALLTGAELKNIPTQKKSGQAIAADMKMRRRMQKQTDRKKALETYRGIVEKDGIEVARQKCLPTIVSKQQRRNQKRCREKTAKKNLKTKLKMNQQGHVSASRKRKKQGWCR